MNKNGLTDDVNILDRSDWRMAVWRPTDREEPSRYEGKNLGVNDFAS